MLNSTASFNSFAAMAAAIARQQNRADVEAAERLRRSAPLRKARKGTGRGPAVAQPKKVI